MDIKEFFKNDHFAAYIGAELTEVGDGYAKARMLIGENHLNGNGTCQGGALFTLADLAFAACTNSHGQLTLSTNANICYVAPAHPGYVYAEAHELVNHHRLPFAEVRITDGDGHLLAVFTSSGYRKKERIV